MIIQCEQCQAKFRLDDSKVKDRGVKVRCAKCKHIFTVTKEQTKTEPLDFGSSLEQTSTNFQEDVPFQIPPPQQEEAQESATEFSHGTDFKEEAADNTFRMESSPFETTASDSTFAPVGNDEFSLSSLEDDKGFAFERDEAPTSHEEVDFGSFDFGGGGADADKTMIAPPSSVDFGDKTMIHQPTPPVDFGTESFEDSVGITQEEQESLSLALVSGADETFSLGEIDSGNESASVAMPQVNQDALKPSQEILLSPPVEAQEKPEPLVADDDDFKKAFVSNTLPTPQDELPPLPITSRRKQSSLLVGLIAAVALLAVVVVGYFGLTSFSDDKDKVVQETGKISLRAVKASYLKNASAGLLLVISGEAINEYPKPRAALQVKGMIFDANGQILAGKSAFCGNLLTKEQLETLPLEKIEAAMANQFGDSLANLEVAPGKKVSFMIVIANPPKEGKDFGVELTGSTVAAGKQQQ